MSSWDYNRRTHLNPKQEEDTGVVNSSTALNWETTMLLRLEVRFCCLWMDHVASISAAQMIIGCPSARGLQGSSTGAELGGWARIELGLWGGVTPRCSLFLVDGKSPYILSFICAASPTSFVLFFSSLIFEVQMLKWLPGNKQHRHFNMKLPASTAPPLCLFVCLGLVEWVAHCAHVGFLWRHLNERCLPLTPPQMLAGTHVALLWKRKLLGCVCVEVWVCGVCGRLNSASGPHLCRSRHDAAEAA